MMEGPVGLGTPLLLSRFHRTTLVVTRHVRRSLHNLANYLCYQMEFKGKRLWHRSFVISLEVTTEAEPFCC